MGNVVFCGISGSGMSALAQILNARGFDVRGSDRSFDQGKDHLNKKALLSVGIKLYPQDGSAVDENTDCLYVSTAVEDTIPDVKRAHELGVAVKKRSDLLAEIFNAMPHSLAVGGTSGKTTVTAMIGFILDKCGKKPTVINGGLLKNYAGSAGIENVIIRDGDICVAEADESDGSIEKYFPYISLVTNITIDHKPISELQKLFSDFTRKATGGIVVNLDDPNSQCLLKTNSKVVSFSIKNSAADIFLTNIKPFKYGVQYELDGKLFTMQIPGAFNVANAAAAIAACSLLGVDCFEAAACLKDFLGTKRRLDVIGTKNEVTVIDDFAHNPDKVLASMSALRDYSGRLLVMFQPHGFSPMRMMGREIIESFAKTMLEDDMLFLPEIFYAGGSVTRDISSKDLVEYAQSLHVRAEFYMTREDVKKRMLALAQKGDRIVIMGARDNSLPDFCAEILNGVKS